MITKEALKELQKHQPIDKEALEKATKAGQKMAVELLINGDKKAEFDKILKEHGPQSKEMVAFAMKMLAEATPKQGKQMPLPITTMDFESKDE